MQTLPPSYMVEIAQQLSFLSAFLGGFSAAVFVTLLVAESPKRSAGLATGASAVAACCFVVALMSFVMVAIVYQS